MSIDGNVDKLTIRKGTTITLIQIKKQGGKLKKYKGGITRGREYRYFHYEEKIIKQVHHDFADGLSYVSVKINRVPALSARTGEKMRK